MWSVSGSGATAVEDGSGGFRVRIEGVGPQLIQFSNRPKRAQENVAPGTFFSAWDKIFIGDPPNALISGRTAQGTGQWAVTIDDPKYDDRAGSLEFTAVELPHVDGALRTGPDNVLGSDGITVVIDDSVLAGDPRFADADTATDADPLQQILDNAIIDISINPV